MPGPESVLPSLPAAGIRLDTLVAVKIYLPPTSNLNVQCFSEIPYISLRFLPLPSQIRVYVTEKVTDFTNRASSTGTLQPLKRMASVED